jgi:hypothetical protein
LEEEALGEQLEGDAGAVVQPGFSAEEDGEVEGFFEVVEEDRESGEELVGVAVGEGGVPVDGGAESFVLIGAEGEVRGEEDGESNAWLLREAAQQRGLVLDGVADEVGEPDWVCDGVLLCCASAEFFGFGLVVEGDQHDGCEVEQDAEAA